MRAEAEIGNNLTEIVRVIAASMVLVSLLAYWTELLSRLSESLGGNTELKLGRPAHLDQQTA